jgi:hypothetical protein
VGRSYKFRGVKCKHIFAIEFSIALRQTIGVTRIDPLAELHVCQLYGSDSVIKDGVRHNESGDIQVYYCRDCRKHFMINLGFKRTE